VIARMTISGDNLPTQVKSPRAAAVIFFAAIKLIAANSTILT
jgi:hypothetical protein